MFVLPVTESLTESLTLELKDWLEMLVWYWHRYHPALSKSTLGILKIAELVLDVWVVLNVLEVFCRMNVTPESCVEIEQVMLTFWPQVTGAAGIIEILGFDRLAETNTTEIRRRRVYILLWLNINKLALSAQLGVFPTSAKHYGDMNIVSVCFWKQVFQMMKM